MPEREFFVTERVDCKCSTDGWPFHIDCEFCHGTGRRLVEIPLLEALKLISVPFQNDPNVRSNPFAEAKIDS